jgi:hypothetical protein
MLQALRKIWEFLFGCWHGRLSRPFTISGDTYKVCLSCGRKLTYSLDTMSIMRTMGHKDVKTALQYQHPELEIARAALDHDAAVEKRT